MSHEIDNSRRGTLKLLASLPLLPLAGGITSVLLNNGAQAAMAAMKSARFVPMAAPTLENPAEMATTTVKSSLVVDYVDGSSKQFSLGYKPFFITGDLVDDGLGGKTLSGGYYDINGKPIMNTNGTQLFSDCPDGTSLLTLKNPKVAGIKGNTVFAVVQFEYASRDANGDDLYGKMPSPIAVLTLDQNPATGELSLVKYHNVDTSSVNGLWITCGSSLSPWNTHLSSEEYEPDAAKANDKRLMSFGKNLFGDANKANPYHYGHMPEVTVNPDGTGSITKHYCMGRISHELVQVMPDERTVLMGDDTTNGGLFMFIADNKRDLSAGTLYVGKWTQTSSEGPGAGDISWINLGQATSDEIKKIVESGITCADIMDVRTEDPNDYSFTKIGYGGKSNWVKLKAGMEKAAAFLETHRYAALVGGSLDFSKMEGTCVNIADRRAYSAMSYVYKSMTDGSGDIQVEGPKAGAVYEHILDGGQKDSAGNAIDSEWVSTHMSAPEALIGEDLAAQDALGNKALADKIANPDNLKFSEKLRTLFIGEDSGNHVNNFLWAYNIDTKELSRVLSCPAGAESTGLQAADEVNGWMYIMSNFQHPGDWDSPLHDKVKDVLDPLVRANFKDRNGAAVGYITGLPEQA